MRDKKESALYLSPVGIPTKPADTGVTYIIPKNMNEDEFIAIVKTMVDLAKIKGLTVRQAQILFSVCAEYVLDCKLV